MTVGGVHTTEFGAGDAARLIGAPAADANKYTRGKLVIVGGSAQYPAAPVMSALAAGRAGAGYTALCVPQSAAGVAHAHLLSTTVEGMTEQDGALCENCVVALERSLAKARAFVVGPGMGRTAAAEAFLRAFLSSPAVRRVPGVVDADALALLAGWQDGLAALRGEDASMLVLTPHAGEAARLLGEGRRVQDPVADVCELATHYKSVVCLKGPDTVIASPDGQVRVVTAGGPELAKAGTGDILAGIIGALLAQGADAFDAACLGVYLHAKAGAMAAADLGVCSVLPEDLPRYIAKAIRSLEPRSHKLAQAQADAERRAASGL